MSLSLLMQTCVIRDGLSMSSGMPIYAVGDSLIAVLMHASLGIITTHTNEF